LWSAAAEVARRDGVNKTAAALHLDGGKLKRRMMADGSVPDKTMPSAFVEMMVPHAVGVSECTIELEGRIFRSRRGTSIRILQFDGQGGFWLATLCPGLNE
jgi:hypothetical protein